MHSNLIRNTLTRADLLVMNPFEVQQGHDAVCCPVREPSGTFTVPAEMLSDPAYYTPSSVQQRAVQEFRPLLEPEGEGYARERAARFLEEALELAQACGLSGEDAAALSAYVFSRPPGTVAGEAPQVAVTLALLADVHGVDVHRAAHAELFRVTTPEAQERLRRKRAARPALGVLPGTAGGESTGAVQSTGAVNPTGAVLPTGAVKPPPAVTGALPPASALAPAQYPAYLQGVLAGVDGMVGTHNPYLWAHALHAERLAWEAGNAHARARLSDAVTGALSRSHLFYAGLGTPGGV